MAANVETTTDTIARFSMDIDGAMAWGPGGSSARDTSLVRAAAGVLRTGSVLAVAAVATGSRPSAATVGAGGMIFDSTLGKPIWSDGSNWVDATGATV